MKRPLVMGLLAAVTFGFGVNLVTTPAQALTKQEIFERCAESIKEEFGEAEFEFKNIRRSSEREWAFGELEMSDGSKRPIRCQIFNRRKVDVKFRGGGDGEDGISPWTSDRPANAGFIKKEEPEKPAESEAEQQGDGTGEKDVQSGPQRRTASGAQAGDGQAGDAAPAKTPEQTAGANQSGDGQTGDAQSGDGEQPKEEKRSGPVFRKVQSQ